METVGFHAFFCSKESTIFLKINVDKSTLHEYNVDESASKGDIL